MPSHHRDAILDETAGREYRIRAWDSHVDVSANGDVVETATVTLEVMAHSLGVLHFRNGSGWTQPDRHRRAVTVEVDTVEVDTVERRDGRRGTSLDTATLWRPDGTVDVLARCPVPAGRHDVLAVRLTYRWPRKLLPLVQGERDRVWMPFPKPVATFRFTMTLPDDRQVHADCSTTALDRRAPATTVDTSGPRTRVELTATDVPANAEISLWLQAGKR
jgi:hypothetical protein